MSTQQKYKYKLTYFNVKGAAEVSRMMFAAAGVKYTDERVTSEDWSKVKPSKVFLKKIGVGCRRI